MSGLDEVKEKADELLRDSDSMKKLIESWLDVSRMEAGAYDEDSHVRSCGAFCPRDTSSRNCIVSRSSG